MTDWQVAGLVRASVFKPLVRTIEQALVIRPLAKLSASDAATLRGVLETIVG